MRLNIYHKFERKKADDVIIPLFRNKIDYYHLHIEEREREKKEERLLSSICHSICNLSFFQVSVNIDIDQIYEYKLHKIYHEN